VSQNSPPRHAGPLSEALVFPPPCTPAQQQLEARDPPPTPRLHAGESKADKRPYKLLASTSGATASRHRGWRLLDAGQDLRERDPFGGFKLIEGVRRHRRDDRAAFSCGGKGNQCLCVVEGPGVRCFDFGEIWVLVLGAFPVWHKRFLVGSEAP
jgi:hypothetical protein